jgi:hypothetical protein
LQRYIYTNKKKTFNQYRVVLTLILTNLSNTIGAYIALGSNYIVINRIILNVVSALVKNKVELNSFRFLILTQE